LKLILCIFAPVQPPLLKLDEVEPKPPRDVVPEPDELVDEGADTRPLPPENGTTTWPLPVR
jgi:hypothetical protein